MDVNKIKVQYYISSSGKNPFDDFLNSLSPSQQSKILRIFVHLKTYGLTSVIPHIKKLKSTPFWEIRILGKDNIRVIFIAFVNNLIIILHGFIKKTQKTPLKEMGVTYNRYRDWLSRNSLDS